MMANIFADASTLPLPNHYPGKVRDVYDLGDGRLLMATSDRLSAFNRAITAVPHKGAILNAITKFWFDRTQDILPNAVIDYPDQNVMVVKKLKMLPIEVIVRGYMTGSTSTSIWTMYKNGARTMYGHSFPDGMVKNQILEKNIVTPTRKTKDDEPITGAEILAENLVTRELWEQTHDMALALFARGQEIAVDVHESDAVDIVLKPGEMSLHHVLIFHGSEPNRADHPRIGFAIRYVPTHVHQLDGGKGSATLVRGTDAFGHFEHERAPQADLHADAVAHHAAVLDHQLAVLYRGAEGKGKLATAM
jgi:hypothetical protein